MYSAFHTVTLRTGSSCFVVQIIILGTRKHLAVGIHERVLKQVHVSRILKFHIRSAVLDPG